MWRVRGSRFPHLLFVLAAGVYIPAEACHGAASKEESDAASEAATDEAVDEAASLSLIQLERIQIFASHSAPSTLARGFAENVSAPSLTKSSSLQQKNLLSAAASEEAVSGDGFIDYAYLLDHFGKSFSIVLLVWLLVLLWLLNSTAQDFFVPPLQYWSNLLNLSPEVSGATLVALGNGAPDIFSMSGAPSASHSFNLAFGGMMSVLCITGASVLYARQLLEDRAASLNEVLPAERLMLDGRHATRSYFIGALWLCAALAYLAYLLKDGDASNFELSILPLLYVGYVGTLVSSRAPKLELQPTAVEKVKLAGETPPVMGLARPEGASTFELFLWLLAWPTYAIRCVLIPPSDLHWDRSRRVISSLAPISNWIFCAVVYLGGCGVLVSSSAHICVSLGVLLCSAAIYCCSNDGPAVPTFYPAITLMAKISSILVLSVIGDELANCAQALGEEAGMSSLVLETTVVSWGNSVGDLVTCIAMVRQGQAEAAYTVVFAGPLFCCLCSLGFALLVTSQRSEGRVDLWDSYKTQWDLEVQVGFLAVACGLVAVLFSRERNGASLFLPAVLGGLYIVYLTCLLKLEWLEP